MYIYIYIYTYMAPWLVGRPNEREVESTLEYTIV